MKVCFVGVGSIGKRHIRNLKSVLVESNIELQLHLLRNTNRKLEEDIVELVQKESYNILELDDYYDAIFITNPTYLHYETLCSLKGRTKHFFVEKPVFDCANVDISEFNETSDTQYYVACPLRYTKVIQRARQILENCKIMSIRAISSSYLPDWRPGIDYRNTYSAHKTQGGGVCIDLIHEWDYICALFGFPEKVFQICGKFSALEIDSEDLAVYVGTYQDKVVELHLDYFGRKTIRQFEVFTQDATYLFDLTNSCIYKNDICIEHFQENVNDKYIEEIRFFCALVKGECENTNDIKHAIRVMKIAEGNL